MREGSARAPTTRRGSIGWICDRPSRPRISESIRRRCRWGQVRPQRTHLSSSFSSFLDSREPFRLIIMGLIIIIFLFLTIKYFNRYFKIGMDVLEDDRSALG